MSNDYQQERLRLGKELRSLQADQVVIAHRIGEIEERLTILNEIDMASQESACHADSCTTGLWPEEAEAIRASDKLVTRESPLEDKYELFIKLFSGRPDVHAMRWRSGEAYSPDCANLWKDAICCKRKDVRGEVKCSECKHRVYAPLDLALFKAHINTTDEGRKTVLGAYPLNAEDNCKFIVADFDGKLKKTKTNKARATEEVDEDASQRAKTIAAAFRTTCLDAGVPISVEISRSGKGYHVWLFFSDWVPGGKARRLFTALWTKTMDESPGLDFSVYDRFIPCQDTVSNSGLDGGIGNLVALPFQGEVGRFGFTVFLDAEFRPYHDQWE
ncbi:MAG: hypothetical protein GX562_03150, partial [Coriobacteriaceae bacterium]|nr:hypothetical protein [Coriobacteriaceae bacterium]